MPLSALEPVADAPGGSICGHAIGEQIAALCVRIDAAQRQLLALLRRFEASGAWGHQGALSVAHWLSWRTGMGLRAAQERARVARALGELPQIDAALGEGRISYCKARALSRVATPDNEADLLELAEHSTGAQLEKICRTYRSVARMQGQTEAEIWQDEERRFVRRRSTGSGMTRIEIQLPPDEAEVVYETLVALAAPDEPEPAEGPRSAERSENQARLADAVVAVMAEARQRAAPGRGGAAHDLMIHTNLTALRSATVGGGDPAGALDDGTLVDAAVLRRVACDCGIVVVGRDHEGRTVDVGRRTRAVPPALRRALRLRDRGCRFPGCGHHRHVDAHHIEHWADGGETSLDNLVLLCRAHHRAIHEEGFRIRRVPDPAGTRLEFLDPRGERIDRCPDRPRDAADFELASWPSPGLDPAANLPKYEGDRLDLGWVLERLLRPSAGRPCAGAT